MLFNNRPKLEQLLPMIRERLTDERIPVDSVSAVEVPLGYHLHVKLLSMAGETRIVSAPFNLALADNNTQARKLFDDFLKEIQGAMKKKGWL